ncbi:hypothetical protein M9435_006883 [Picochlorum sp. BPE23]|nr:hypothetical protein M9435_006883 [Picochlorum sp. BPE23]
MGETSREELVALGRKKLEEFRQRRRDEERQSKASSLQLKEEAPGPRHEDAAIVTSNARVESEDDSESDKMAANADQVSLASTQSEKQALGTDVAQCSTVAGSPTAPRESMSDQEDPATNHDFDKLSWGGLESRRDSNFDEIERVEVANLQNSSAATEQDEKIQFDANAFLIPRDDAQRDRDMCIEELDGASPDDVSKDDGEEEEGVDIKSSVLFEKRRKFERLQEHIDALTSEKMDLSLCLQQQTNIVRRLTEENERMVKKLNDAASKEEHLQELVLNLEKDKKAIETRALVAEKELDIKERENRGLTAKVKVLGSELVTLEENLFHVKERMQSESIHEKGRDAEEHHVRTYQKENDELRSEICVLQDTIGKLQQALRESEVQRAAALEAQDAQKQELVQTNKENRSCPLTRTLALRSISNLNSSAEGRAPSNVLPVETQALLPNRACLLKNDLFQEDIESLAERVYFLLDRNLRD